MALVAARPGMTDWTELPERGYLNTHRLVLS